MPPCALFFGDAADLFAEEDDNQDFQHRGAPKIDWMFDSMVKERSKINVGSLRCVEASLRAGISTPHVKYTHIVYSTVTLLARLRGLSTSQPRNSAM